MFAPIDVKYEGIVMNKLEFILCFLIFCTSLNIFATRESLQKDRGQGHGQEQGQVTRTGVGTETGDRGRDKGIGTETGTEVGLMAEQDNTFTLLYHINCFCVMNFYHHLCQ